MSDFVHLHVHTQYSLLDGLCQIPALVDQAKAFDQEAIAITDHGAMYGVVHFYNACLEAGIKPIIGVEAYMSETSRHQKQSRPGADQYHLTLIAKNDIGYRNLMRLTSIAHLEGFSYKPRLDKEVLAQHAQGIIATSGCSSGIIPKKLLQDQSQEAVNWVKWFTSVFGDDFYIEIQSHPQLEMVETVRPQLIDLAARFGLPLLATNDVHYLHAGDATAQDALLAVQMRKLISDKNRLSMLDSPDFYLKSSTEMAAAFAKYPEAIKNTVKLAQGCSVTIPTGKMIFPNYPLPAQETPESALTQLAWDRLPQRFPKPDSAITARLKYELEIITSKGYASYFLIVQDFVNWAKSQGIRVGPGRGSAAGSLVSYVLRITSIDPLLHNLPFERFMNPQRPSPPDIDIDIADEHRDQVIRYVADKYGEDHVAQIITFGTMEARASIRDIGRVLGMPFSEPDKIAKLIPQGYSIEEAVTSVFELQQLYQDPRYKQLLDLAKRVEGVARHASVHAAGVVIADKPLTHYTPVQRESRGGKVITQYDMYALDLNIQDNAIGLLKMDFLGLRNLSILGKSIEYVKTYTDAVVDLSSIPLDDPKVYTMLSTGETTGVFQLESPGMRRVARSLKPTRFSDITAMVALYRPGPMELIDDFITGKKNPNKIKYPHPDLKPVLEETYGIPVYQEQVLQIANVFAGYSLGEADILRRAIGKKKRSILDKEKKRFIAGASAKGYSEKKANEIWHFIEKFAGYGFNKAHSASYAMIAYQTAYMKVNFPVEYMAAFLSIETGSHSANRETKVVQAISECKRMGIVVLPPDINGSEENFSLEKLPQSLGDQAIRFGLSAVKNVGSAAVDSIFSARDQGPFLSVTDFFARVDNRKVNKKVAESLVRVGCFDAFGDRAAILQTLDDLRTRALSHQKNQAAGQASLFAQSASASATAPVDHLPAVPPLSATQRLSDEKSLLGVYVSDHPLSPLQSAFRQQQLIPLSQLDPTQTGPVKVGGLLSRLRLVNTKTGNHEMAFATLEDGSGDLDLVIFPKTYAQVKDHLQTNVPLVLMGNLETRDQKTSLIVSHCYPFDRSQTSDIQVITIPRGTSQAKLSQIGRLLKQSPGDSPLEIHIPVNGTVKKISLPYTVSLTASVKNNIESILKSGSS